MDRNFRFTSLWIAAATVLIFSACSKAPGDEAERARAAISAAKAVKAEIYAPSAFRAASDSLVSADAEKTSQDSKFAMARKYGRAKDLYLSAARLGQEAAESAVTTRERVQRDATASLESLRQILDETVEMLGSDRGQALLAARGTAAGMNRLQGEATDVATALGAIEQAIQEERYQQALQMSRAAEDQAKTIRAEVYEAVETGVIPKRGDK